MRLLRFSTRCVFPLAASAFLVGLLLSSVSTALVQEVAVVPPQPSRCDSLFFHVTGHFPDGCWHYDGYDVSILPIMNPSAPFPMTVYMMRVFSHHYDNVACPLVIVPYEVSHFAGLVRPGPYRLMVVEVDSQDPSKLYDQKEIDFTVRDSCGPVETCVMPGFAPGDNGCNATVGPSRPGFLTVTLNNSMPIAGAEIIVDGFQQIRNLPCGQGTFCGWNLSVSGVVPVMRAADMGVEWTFTNGRLHLMLYPLSMTDGTPGLGIIEPGDGPVARISLELFGDSLNPFLSIPDYDINVVLSPVAFADEQGLAVPACPTFAPISGTVCIRNAAKCDINADGRSDVVDIVNMIKCIMCTIPEGCCTPEQILRSDCNGDGVLNVNDVVCCIRYILGSLCLWCDTEPGGNQGTSNSPSIGLSGDVSWESDTRFTVPITFASSLSTGGIETRIAYDPQVLTVDKITIPAELNGAELFYTASGGELSIMVVAMGSNPLPPGDEGILARVSFAFAPGSNNKTAEIVMEGAAGADSEGNRLSLMRTNDKVSIEPRVAPPVRLSSRPNPFLSSTDVNLSIASGQEGLLAVYDVSGRLVRTLHSGYLPAGVQTFRWDGKDGAGLEVRSGVYFVKYDGKGNNLTGKMVLLRGH